jgi:hypothetical protein
VPGTAGQFISVISAAEHVPAVVAKDLVLTRISADDVVIVTSKDVVISSSTINFVIASPCTDGVVSAATSDEVLLIGSHDDTIAGDDSESIGIDLDRATVLGTINNPGPKVTVVHPHVCRLPIATGAIDVADGTGIGRRIILITTGGIVAEGNSF